MAQTVIVSSDGRICKFLIKWSCFEGIDATPKFLKSKSTMLQTVWQVVSTHLTSINGHQVHHRVGGGVFRLRLRLRRLRRRQEGPRSRRHDSTDRGDERVVAGDGQQVPGVASHRRTARRHEPRQAPQLHRQVV